MLALNGCATRTAESPAVAFASAESLYRAESYQEALVRTQEGLRRNSPSTELYWRFRILQARILLGKREAVAATEALKFELPLHARTPRNLAAYDLCLGFASGLQRNFPEAMAHFDKAIATAQAAGETELLAELANRKGLVATGQGKSAEAWSLYQQARDYARGHNVHWLEIASTGNLGFQLMEDRKYDEAIPWFDAARTLAHQYHAVESEGRNVGNKGLCLYYIGEDEKALASFNQAVKIFEATGNRAELQVWLGDAGSAYARLNQSDDSIRCYQKALELARQLHDRFHVRMWLTGLAQREICVGRTDLAEKYNEEALALQRQQSARGPDGYLILNQVRIRMGRHQYAEAEKGLRELLGNRDAAPATVVTAYEYLGLTLAATGRATEADRQFKVCLAELEQLRHRLTNDESRRAFLSSLIVFFHTYTEFLMGQGRPSDALEIVESSHARTLRDRLRASGSRDLPAPRARGLESLAAASGSILVSYSVSDRKSWGWVVTPQAVHVFEVPSTTQLRPLIQAHDAAIQQLEDPLARESSSARRLFDVLVAPAIPYLGNSRRVIIAPDGILNSVNFETLIAPGDKPHYWIEDVSIAVSPSLTLLRADRTPPRAASLLLIGDANAVDPEFPKLSFSATEMESIERNLSGASRTVLRGPEAKPAAWETVHPEKFDLIHFSTHAAANPQDPLESAVILSPDSAAFGARYKLRAADIAKNPLTARLVTLSACRSAGSRIYEGEGIVGLSWAFLQSGAHNVIAGLWDVNDESATRIMGRLYGGLAKGETPTGALRSAKLDLIHSGTVYRKPWYWGALQLFSTDAR